MRMLEGSMQVRCNSEVVSLGKRRNYWLRREKWNLGSRDRVGMLRGADLMMRGANLTPNIIKYNLMQKCSFKGRKYLYIYRLVSEKL